MGPQETNLGSTVSSFIVFGFIHPWKQIGAE
jgi:hypothetical protein